MQRPTAFFLALAAGQVGKSLVWFSYIDTLAAYQHRNLGGSMFLPKPRLRCNHTVRVTKKVNSTTCLPTCLAASDLTVAWMGLTGCRLSLRMAPHTYHSQHLFTSYGDVSSKTANRISILDPCPFRSQSLVELDCLLQSVPILFPDHFLQSQPFLFHWLVVPLFDNV